MCGETNEKKLEKAHETEGTTTNWTLGEISHLSMHTRKEKRGKMFVAAFRLTYCALLCCRA